MSDWERERKGRWKERAELAVAPSKLRRSKQRSGRERENEGEGRGRLPAQSDIDPFFF